MAETNMVSKKQSDPMPTVLEGVRVVEIGDEPSGAFAARLLANAGAQVIRIAFPGGDPSRPMGSLAPSGPGAGGSVRHQYLNAGKLGAVADLGTSGGRARVDALLQGADVLVAHGPAKTIESHRLRYANLAGTAPRLIVLAITPFGLDGPNSSFVGDELVAVSAGGLAFATPGVPDGVKDPDREPPLRANTFVSGIVAGIQGAAAALLGLRMRDQTGKGMEIDLSMQEAIASLMTWEIANASYFAPKGRAPDVAGSQPNAYLPCKDGYVVVAGFLEHHWRALVSMMGNPDWADVEIFASGAERARNWDALEPLLTEWTLQHAGEEIAGLGQKAGVPCFPAFGIGQMVNSAHVRERGYLREVRGDHGQTMLLPGMPVRMSATPWRAGTEAPLPLSQDLVAWPPGDQGRGVPGADRVHTPGRGREKPGELSSLFEGLRVLDFGQLIAVPYATQILAWLGAEVILVENPQILPVRVLPPYADGIRGLNRSGGFNLLNTSKRGITLDLRKAADRKAAEELVAISDVVVENFATGVMDKLGLSYETARRLRPDVVYLSLAAFGRTGPMKDFAGFHSVINAFSGVAAVTGYPGGHPRILGGFLPDFLSGCYCLLAMLEALDHRGRTGNGQFVEVSMTEGMTTLIPEAVAEYSLHGTEPQRVGNRDKEKAPHNVYRCRGDQQWVAISVEGDNQFAALCAAMDRPGVANDARFSNGQARRRHLDELDALIASWTGRQAPDEVALALQRRGVLATAVLDAGRLLHDAHLTQRGFVASVEHPETGSRLMGTTAWRINGERPRLFRHAPLLGQDSEYVLRELLSLPVEHAG